MRTEDLIWDLRERTRGAIDEVEKFRQLPVEALNRRVSQDTWSVLECIEHLNRYGDFYIPELTKQISSSQYTPVKTFKSGILGNFFVKSIDPDKKLKKMKAPESMNPIGSSLTIEVLDKFLIQQFELQHILQKATTVNLEKTKTKISISRFIKLRLGDTLRFLILHNQRHIRQAKNVLKTYKMEAKSELL